MNALRNSTVQPIRSKNKIEEIKQLLKMQSYRDYFLFVLGINCGLRISDMLQLKVGDVLGKEHIQLKEGKTDKYKRFRVNAALQEEISIYTAFMLEEEYLFPSRKGVKPITRVQAYRILNDAAENIRLSFYKKTKDVAMLQDIFNHSAPIVTKRYIEISQDKIDQAIDEFSL